MIVASSVAPGHAISTRSQQAHLLTYQLLNYKEEDICGDVFQSSIKYAECSKVVSSIFFYIWNPDVKKTKSYASFEGDELIEKCICTSLTAPSRFSKDYRVAYFQNSDRF